MSDTTIRNFGWVEAGKLARGEQPPLNRHAYAALRELGITCVFSLREQGEEACEVVGRDYPRYRTAQEDALCRGAGLSFHHSPCRDGQSPSPENLTAALRRIAQEVERGGAVYLHCVAGIGRTGIVSAAWLMHRGASGDEAARNFLAYMLDAKVRGDALCGYEQEGFFHVKVLREQWWALLRIAEALGTPLHDTYSEPTPLKPPYADGWEEGYARLLAPLSAR